MANRVHHGKITIIVFLLKLRSLVVSTLLFLLVVSADLDLAIESLAKPRLRAG